MRHASLRCAMPVQDLFDDIMLLSEGALLPPYL